MADTERLAAPDSRKWQASNRLPLLQDVARDSHAESQRLAVSSVQCALATGAALSEAKGLCPHGSWASWLAATGIPERSAQRYMRLHRLALKSDMVTDLGGIGAALEWAKSVRLPKSGELFVSMTCKAEPGIYAPLVCVWYEGGGFQVGLLDLNSINPQSVTTRRPILYEFGVWATVWHLLERNLASVSFCILGAKEAEARQAFLNVMAEVRAEVGA